MKKPVIKIESYINEETKEEIKTILKTVCDCLNVFRVRVRTEEGNKYVLHFYFENGFNYTCDVDVCLLNSYHTFVIGRMIIDDIKAKYLLERGLTHQ